MADSSFRVELALRAGQLAKSALGMTTLTDPATARIWLSHVVRDVKEMDDFLQKVEASRG